MLTYSFASHAAPYVNADGDAPGAFNDPNSQQRSMSPRVEKPAAGSGRPIDIFPAHSATRRAIEWDGIGVEIVQGLTADKIEFQYCAPRHLLLVHEQGVRDFGETLIEDYRSTLQTLKGKLTFVPAGCRYFEWQCPRIRSRIICFYFDPAKMPVYRDADSTAFALPARVLFENNGLWGTAVKLAAAIEEGAYAERYFEALAVIIAHELLDPKSHLRARKPLARGGLAVWQQRIVATHIEEHLSETVSLAALAGLVELSSSYFCRAFKQSFGVPPHRYHINRRIERAKALLADPARLVTETGLVLGFRETSSFSAAFRQVTGMTPTQYQRALG